MVLSVGRDPGCGIGKRVWRDQVVVPVETAHVALRRISQRDSAEPVEVEDEAVDRKIGGAQAGEDGIDLVPVVVAELGNPQAEGLARRHRRGSGQLHIVGAQIRQVRSRHHVPAQLVAEHPRLPPERVEVPLLPVDVVHHHRVVQPVVADRVIDRDLDVADRGILETLEPVAEIVQAFADPVLDPVAIGGSLFLELLTETVDVLDAGGVDVEPLRRMHPIQTNRAEGGQIDVAPGLVADLHAEIGGIDLDADVRGLEHGAAVDERRRSAVVGPQHHRRGVERLVRPRPRADRRRLEMDEVVVENLDDQIAAGRRELAPFHRRQGQTRHQQRDDDERQQLARYCPHGHPPCWCGL